jgi:hypothetical protein
MYYCYAFCILYYLCITVYVLLIVYLTLPPGISPIAVGNVCIYTRIYIYILVWYGLHSADLTYGPEWDL